MDKPTLLLHSCCAPCSGPVLERLCANYQVTIYYCNPNIHPKSEYQRRMQELAQWCRSHLEIPLVVPDYKPRDWFEEVRGLEDEPEKGERCTKCFRMRLEETAHYAATHGFDLFTTTLTISPHKDSARINILGRELGERYHVSFLEENFKKKGGFQRSLELSREFGFYRQNYCGCLYSLQQTRSRDKKRAED